jgi:hypothetical protein
VLIRRCAWHRTYYRYPLAIGVASWRGLGLSFTDGMCGGCAVHFRRQWGLPDLPAPDASVESFAPGMAFLRVAATFLLIVGFMFEARLLDEVGTPPLRLTSAPETVLVPPAPAEAEPASAAAAPAPARRPRHVVSRRSTAAEVPAAVAAPSTIGGEPSEADASVASTAVELVRLPEAAPDPDRAPPWTRRPAGSPTFAALPHAGLTQQAP